MDLFEKPVYLYGKIVKNKFITPYKSYDLKFFEELKDLTLSKNLKANFLPAILQNNTLSIFYAGSKIFNSFVISREENVFTLFSLDKKLTICSEKLKENQIYTFITEKEDENLRKAKIFKFDFLYPGTKITGKVIKKKGKYFVSTIYGEGNLVLQNNIYDKKIEVILFRKDDKLHFVQVDNPVIKAKVKIESRTSGYYTVSDKNIKGILFSGNQFKIGDLVEVVVRNNNLGFYIFDEDEEKEEDGRKEDEVSKGKKAVEGKIERKEIEGNKERKEIEGRKEDEGKKVTSVEENDKKIDIPILSLKTPILNIKTPPVLSIPFDLPSEEEDDKNEDKNIDNFCSLEIERKRSKIQNDDDFLMEIKAFPGKAFPILKYFQFLIETNRQKEAVDLFHEYYPSLVGREKDDLSIAFVNFLIFTGDKTLFSTVKKLAQNCSIRFLEVITSNSNNLEISKLYYKMFPNKNSYHKYLNQLFENDLKEAYNLVESNPKYLNLAIPLLYKYTDNPRNKIEKLIHKQRESWFEYLNNEKGEYKRHLFRRVIEFDWNKKDMKKFFKKWLEFENEENGDVEEVKARAKEYVEKYGSK
ncbi:hypothetical protein NBO_127g0001 [Nosema bombycis CQ1]|uniref:Uncharacterized protein n=1 Tax=Nosema bombycis (strain CQ1 / CVCC 102059) TaxID=578461 RepID=R0KR28_NOSB1|nr:hypothetical protein NBO_127g0001 [Nosema bombycis CQ1]|eukprot:EOB13191.1 hypothetical protein NBO_127g0001 [Nosema bombycis CQ1]